MYLKRKIDAYLSEWKNDPERKPLIIKGARQIGKTESIRSFAKANYSIVVEINFIEEPQFKTILEDGYRIDAILHNLTRIDPSIRLTEKETLLFFDEMQAYPDIVTSLKFFAQNGKYDVICSGSMLGLNYRQIESISVGYKTDHEMHSMDFEEFLWAKGYGEDAIEELFEKMMNAQPIGASFFQAIEREYLDFVILGGMPEVVARYVDNRNFSTTAQLQQQLIAAYKEDIRKYAIGADQARISRVFDAIPVQLSKENKKFQISKVVKGARFHNYAGCIEWLKDAGIINLCYCLHFPELPLKGNYDDSKFKIYFADTGIFVAMLDDEAQEDLRLHKNLGVYAGALYENMVGEALKKSGADLFYYKREDGTLEEDFFLRTKDRLVPVEVKARSGRSQSLRSLIRNDRYEDISWGVKLVAGNIGFENDIYTFPHFCAFLLKEWVRKK